VFFGYIRKDEAGRIDVKSTWEDESLLETEEKVPESIPAEPADILSVLTEVQRRAGKVECSRCHEEHYRALCLRIALGTLWTATLCPECLKRFVSWYQQDPALFESYVHEMTNPNKWSKPGLDSWRNSLTHD
jgi:late competence protein required for DNA uptake (superfamily II DNA/RNA helicase)